MHFEKFQLDQIKWRLIGHCLFSHGQYLVNCARWLDHYYKIKCEFLKEDAPLEISSSYQIQNG